MWFNYPWSPIQLPQTIDPTIHGPMFHPLMFQIPALGSLWFEILCATPFVSGPRLTGSSSCQLWFEIWPLQVSILSKFQGRLIKPCFLWYEVPLHKGSSIHPSMVYPSGFISNSACYQVSPNKVQCQTCLWFHLYLWSSQVHSQ